MRSWSPWFARNVAYVRKKHKELPQIGAVVEGIDVNKITNDGMREYVDRKFTAYFARRLL